MKKLRVLRIRGISVLLCALLCIAGCTAVPTNSDPQVVRPLGAVSSGSGPASTPIPGADPRSIVQQFLQANVSSFNDRHAAARAFLTSDAKGRWNDSTVTVLDSFTVGVSDTANNVVVTGQQLGSLDSRGIFTPDLTGDGSTAGDAVSYTFVLREEGGQWRIQQPPNGILLQRSDFQSKYSVQSLYFFDLAQQHLVPDLRYTPLTNEQALDSWRLSQLQAGPRPELINAVQQLPTQVNNARDSVTEGIPEILELPGSAQLESSTLQRLAALIAVNFDPDSADLQLRITDGGKPVSIPTVGQTFTRSDFTVDTAESATAQLFYLNANSAIVDEGGTPLSGAVQSGHGALNRIALSGTDTSTMQVAATTGPAIAQHLLIGSVSTGLHDAGVAQGALTAPSWAPNASEVWVGSGASVVRVRSGAQPEVLSLGSHSPGNATVVSMQISPEGTRVALVLATADGASSLWVGTLVRAGDSVRIDTLSEITPDGLAITDVSWSGDSSLYVIGTDTTTGVPGIWSVRCDGSGLTERSRTGLPRAPDSITAAAGMVAWVSAGGAVFEQSRNNTWIGPNDSTTRGGSPTYSQ